MKGNCVSRALHRANGFLPSFVFFSSVCFDSKGGMALDGDAEASASASTSGGGGGGSDDAEERNGRRTDDDRAFECNICLDTAKDAVISMCGHLFW